MDLIELYNSEKLRLDILKAKHKHVQEAFMRSLSSKRDDGVCQFAQRDHRENGRRLGNAEANLVKGVMKEFEVATIRLTLLCIPDGTGKPGLPAYKVHAAIRMLAYGNAADAVDEYLRLGASTALKCLHKFNAIIFLRGGLPQKAYTKISNDYSRLERRVDFPAQ
ncbi:unnamed protein product [Microthlaspi erraticum]|uniref:Uncharacterized protein n=1 Tax=Microthlaspi erraticum TaxID=1685480 RepID=A0A6D2J5Y3_9BRAS|nr:unnamed protein product [Microthlaspi erraticum]